MVKYAVVKTGGKQYLVKEGDEIIVDRLSEEEKKKIDLETLAIFEDDKEIQLGTPVLSVKIKGEILEHLKGEKIRVARFKSKVRYRKVKGFRPQLTRIKIVKI